MWERKKCEAILPFLCPERKTCVWPFITFRAYRASFLPLVTVLDGSDKTHTNMQTQINRFLIALSLSIGIASFAIGCASNKAAKEVRVSLPQLSPPARATVEKLTVGGAVDKIDREFERGKVVYDVEATLAGKHVEYLIADSNGEVLGTENEIEFSQLPEPVRAAAVKYFAATSGLKAMKGIEYGETHYEIEGPKNGKTVEVTFDPMGKPGK